MQQAWQLQEAKNHLSELVNKALQHHPQIITRHGKDAVVVVSIDDYKKLIKPKESLADFFRKSPLTKVKNLDLKRNKDTGRNMDL